MHRSNKIQAYILYGITLSSLILGALIGLLILQEHLSEGAIFNKNSQESLQLNAYFKNDRLVVSITNLGNSEVEIQIVFLEGQNYIDFDAPINLMVKSGETAEIQTDIMKPKPGTYTVKVRLSNGQTINCKITVATG